MAESEINIINHLIEVELQASSLVKEAQSEADKRLSACLLYTSPSPRDA